MLGTGLEPESAIVHSPLKGQTVSISQLVLPYTGSGGYHFTFSMRDQVHDP